jgi:hypothetical protein
LWEIEMAAIDWAALLVEEDVEGLWNALYQLISRHPAVRPLHFSTDSAAVASYLEINADVTQELFLELFQKRRFDHYAVNLYTSSEIENEISHLEIPNLVGARLRKRFPESFRMARRVSVLLKESPEFKQFGAVEHSGSRRRARGEGKLPSRRRKAARKIEQTASGRGVDYYEDESLVSAEQMFEPDSTAAVRINGQGDQPRRGRMVNQVFGLSGWNPSKPVGDSGHFAELITNVSMRRRDTRIVGRSGSSQLILSNRELEKLIVEIFEAIDSPADVRTIRQLTLSKIPLQDYSVDSLDAELTTEKSNSPMRREAPDLRDTPEAILLKEERNGQLERMADQFLMSLRRAVNNNERRYTRLIKTLWHCYYDPDGPSQLEIAETLGVSDSLVSDNRRLIEHELRKLNLSIEEGHVFSDSLCRLIARIVDSEYVLA